VASPPDERITIGLVRGLHGLRGAVRIEVLSDDPERFSEGSVVYVDGDSSPLTVAWMQPTKPGILVRFAEADSREQVEGLRDRYLEAVPGEALPAGTWYWHQVKGLEVVTDRGETLGTVSEVMRVGEAEVYIVRGGQRGEVLVPAVRPFMTELDPGQGRLVVDAQALDLPVDPPPQRPPKMTRQRLTRLERQSRDPKKQGGSKSKAKGAPKHRGPESPTVAAPEPADSPPDAKQAKADSADASADLKPADVSPDATDVSPKAKTADASADLKPADSPPEAKADSA
jgi:16S rRNA processing protein RimM